MKMIWICLIIPTILALPFSELHIDSDNDCWRNENNTINRKYGVLVNFSPKVYDEKENCAVHIANPWSSDMQNGFGIFLPRSIDCSLNVTVECLSMGNLLKPMTLEYTCYTNSRAMEMPCNLIGLTFRGNSNVKRSNELTNIQVVALAKEPCMDRDILFQCPNDYPHSCIDRTFKCNGRSECPSGDDERGCNFETYSDTIPLRVIILVVLGTIFSICIISTVLICCCCRVAFNAVIHRLCPTEKKGETMVVAGEDAGLMKGLTTPSVIEVLPAQHTEPTSLMIDSTKPVYPHLP